MEVEISKFREEYRMIINHNLNAMNAHRNLEFNNAQQGKQSEKLSSGYRINRAADDAAGLSISQKMRASITSLNQAQRNAQDGVSLVQTAEGAMGEVSDMLTRMKQLAVQAGNGTYNTSDLAAMNAEYTSLKTAINDVAINTKFNGQALLNTSTTMMTIQTGETGAVTVGFSLQDITTTTLGITSALTSVTTASTAMGELDVAIGKVNTGRSAFGAVQNQLEHVFNNLGATAENLQAAESRIRDTDMAKEMMAYTKYNVLQQASTAMLAQANQSSQGVLQLLR
jgi:flagellin